MGNVITPSQKKFIAILKKELKPVLKKFIGDPVDNNKLRKAVQPVVDSIKLKIPKAKVKVKQNPELPEQLICTIEMPFWKFELMNKDDL